MSAVISGSHAEDSAPNVISSTTNAITMPITSVLLPAARAGADDAAGELDLQPGLARGLGDPLQRGLVSSVSWSTGTVKLMSPNAIRLSLETVSGVLDEPVPCTVCGTWRTSSSVGSSSAL